MAKYRIREYPDGVWAVEELDDGIVVQVTTFESEAVARAFLASVTAPLTPPGADE